MGISTQNLAARFASTEYLSASVGGQPSTATWLPLSRLAGDTVLSYVLGAAPNPSWGSASADAPPSFDAPRATTSSPAFLADFDRFASQPDWNDNVDFQANVGGFCCALNHMQTSTRREGIAHSGGTALMYSGIDNDATGSFSHNRVFDVRIPVTAATRLDYWIYPQSGASNSNDVAVDLIFTDGSSLRDSGAVDQNGVRVHPEFQGRGGKLRADAWNEVRSDIGRWAAGKTVARILVGHDWPDATGSFRGYVDDVRIGALQIAQARGSAGRAPPGRVLSAPRARS